MSITRQQLRQIIKEELLSLNETQMSSENPITNQAFEPPDGTSRPYITGTVSSSDLKQSLNSPAQIEDEDQAVKLFIRKEKISSDDYQVSCEKGDSGSWSCMARKSTLGPESSYSGESEFGPAGSESI